MLAGVRLLGFVRIFEGLGNRFPLKLLLSVELVSGVLELGIGLVEIGKEIYLQTLLFLVDNLSLLSESLLQNQKWWTIFLQKS